MFLDTMLWQNNNEPLRAEHSGKFFGYDIPLLPSPLPCFIRVLCFDVNAQNNQIALMIIIWNIHFWRLILIFVAVILFDKMWTKDIFDVDTPTILSKSSYHRYPSNKKS